MKTTNLLLGAAVIALGFTSCKDEKAEKAEKSVETYVVYVDSVGNVAPADAKTNWEAIDASYQMRINEAEAALADMKEKEKAQERIDASRAKYEAWKAKMNADMNNGGTTTTTTEVTGTYPYFALRNSLFGEGKIGKDVNFDWVNKDNIHDVFQQFVHTAENNKDSYSREDWDEIKLLWEALNTRKNTVEKEGLTSKDNLKIAGLKIKFGPMLKVNRIGAKNGENQRAKDEAN